MWVQHRYNKIGRYISPDIATYLKDFGCYWTFRSPILLKRRQMLPLQQLPLFSFAWLGNFTSLILTLLKTENKTKNYSGKVIENGNNYSENRKVIVPAQPKCEKITQYPSFKEPYFCDPVYNAGLFYYATGNVLGTGIPGFQSYCIYVHCFDSFVYCFNFYWLLHEPNGSAKTSLYPVSILTAVI